jgi:hypothetical protein
METTESKTDQQKQAERYKEIGAKHGSGEMTLENMIESIFITKNLDDLFLAQQSVMSSLKGNPFNPMLLERKGKILHDIATLQPLVAAMGMRFARHIERKYEVRFKFLNGGVSDPTTEGKSEFEKAIDKAADGNKTPSIVLTKS